MFRKILASALIATLLVLFSAFGALAGISIAPAFVEIDMSKGQPSGQFVITNNGDEPERYRIKAAHFGFSPTGNLLSLPEDKNSLSSWIKFNPKELTLAPKTNQRVRFVIVPKGKLEDQEYWAAMEMESLKTNTTRTKDGAGRTLKLEVSSSVMVPIFARHGEVAYQCQIDELQLVRNDKGATLQVTVNNNGTGHLYATGTFEIRAGDGSMLSEGNLGNSYIMPGNLRKFAIPIEEKLPGQVPLSIKAVYSAPQMKESVEKSVQVTI
ncbi:MAG: hypothetical protein KKD63_04805 [Proteobacteria bacterium]|nr:molecular chaperone [Desulfobulbaceae bacterium]MBU4152181.1 hypothetical protein [Pseudomonadota bacterium]MDP2104826.1 hypothetical protein [Desulfobulbaceae bacterium]